MLHFYYLRSRWWLYWCVIYCCFRSEIQHPTTMENLPDDLLSNIFIRLLAKQLAQMRSISKSWNAFLSQPSFVKSHLLFSIYNNDKTLFHFSDEYSLSFELVISPNLQLNNFIKLPANPEFPYISIRVIDSVNGLICSSYSDSIIQICMTFTATYHHQPPVTPRATLSW